VLLGQTGLFPASYVEIFGLSSTHSDTSASSSGPSVTKPHGASSSRRASCNGCRSNVSTPKHKLLSHDSHLKEVVMTVNSRAISTAVYGAFYNHSKTFSTDGSEDLHDTN